LRVLDCNHGLSLKRGARADFVVRGGAHLLADNPGWPAPLDLPGHLHDETFSGPNKVSQSNNGRIAVSVRRQGSNIFEVYLFVGLGTGAEGAVRVRLERRARAPGCVGRWRIVERDGTEVPLLVKIHLAKVCAANARGVLKHLLEYGRQVAR